MTIYGPVGVLRAVVCPDKFKGTLGAAEAAAALAAGLARGGFEDVAQIPMADGGEGTLDALLAARGGSRRRARVTGPLGDPVDAEWGVLADGTAVSSNPLARAISTTAGRNDALRASTRGTGELIAAARAQGCTRIVVAVGGSATTDGGLAAVEALGWSLQGCEVTVACDVTTGFTDAAARFGPQKGASPAEVALLERRLGLVAETYRDRTGRDVTALAGAGAAGGLAGGLAAIGARIVPGFEAVAEAVGLEEQLVGADLVVTGEGRVDATSFDGKVVGGVLEWAADVGVEHAAVVAGRIDADARDRLAAMTPPPVALALVDRAFDEADSAGRAALLAEEAALEVARTVLRGD
jgi:glycerate kinase